MAMGSTASVGSGVSGEGERDDWPTVDDDDIRVG